MKLFIEILQIISAFLTIILVLIQVRGTGISRTSVSSFTRRGLEKMIFKFTFIAVGIFLLTSAILLFI